MQPHMKKCFEGISKLRFEKDLDITAMFSKEGEEVKFIRSCNPQVCALDAADSSFLYSCSPHCWWG